MGEMRIDYLSGSFMIVRKNDDFGKGLDSSYAPGNETQTNPSILSLVIKEGMMQTRQDIDDQVVKDWSIRVFANRNPIVSEAKNNEYGKPPFESQPAHGYHYTLVASPDPRQTFATIDVEQWSRILVVVQDRLKWLYTRKGVSYVAIYADHDGTLDKEAKMHPYLNIMSLKMIPPTIEREIGVHHQSQEKHAVCPICQIIKSEDRSRRILQTENFVAFCPWSPSYPLEFCIAPKRHSMSFAKTSQKDLYDLALIIRAMLGGLTSLVHDITYSIAFHLSAEKKSSRQIHWHIEVYPVTKKWTGIERGYGIHVNDVSPEDAAKKLGAECKKELANIVGVGS